MPFQAAYELSSLDGRNGFVLRGVNSGDQSGRSVSSAGDINNDGITDLIIGAPFTDLGDQISAGASYVVFGNQMLGSGGVLELSSLGGNNGFVANGVNFNDFSGFSVSSAGDFNNDGITDLIIGTPFAAPEYVVFGSSTLGSGGVLELSSLDGSNGTLVSVGGGRSISSGDVNGDGITDLIIGAPGASPPNRLSGPVRLSGAGETYVVFGGGGSIVFSGVGLNSGDASGFSVSSAGDINNDGITDLIIGAPFAEFVGSPSDAGVSYLLFGRPMLGGDLLFLDRFTSGFALSGVGNGDNSGNSVSSAGDVNNDGVSDLIIGASLADPGGRSDAGASYVVFGSSTLGPSLSSNVFELSSLDGSNGFVVNGVSAGDQSGFSVSSTGDINDDGITDLIIGAPLADPGGRIDAGASYVVFGSSTLGSSGVLELSGLDGSNGFILRGVNGVDQSGSSVSSAGDINNDGITDLIIGARFADPGGRLSAGASYVVFGNVPPVINSNQLTLQEEGTVTLCMANLNVTDNNHPADSLQVTVSNIQHGQFELVSAPEMAITSFTQQQVVNGAVQFVHDGGELPPSYDVMVSDGSLSAGPQAAAITFTNVNDAPVLTNNTLSAFKGQTVALTQANLRATDVDDVLLTFSVSNIQYGRFELANAPSVAITGFTQPQVIADNVRFIHDCGDLAPRYDVLVSDGNLSAGPQAAEITYTNINDAPVVTNLIPDQVLKEGEDFSFTIAPDTITDPEGQALTYFAQNTNGTTSLPSWMSFENEMRTFSGTPTSDAVGPNRFRFFGQDACNGTASTDFNVNVAAKNSNADSLLIGIIVGVIGGFCVLAAASFAVCAYVLWSSHGKKTTKELVELDKLSLKKEEMSQIHNHTATPPETEHRIFSGPFENNGYTPAYALPDYSNMNFTK